MPRTWPVAPAQRTEARAGSMQRPLIFILARCIRTAGHALKDKHVEHPSDGLFRRVFAERAARDFPRLYQQLLRLGHRVLHREVRAVSLHGLHSSMRTSRSPISSEFSGDHLQKFLPMVTSQRHANVLGGIAR